MNTSYLKGGSVFCDDHQLKNLRTRYLHGPHSVRQCDKILGDVNTFELRRTLQNERGDGLCVHSVQGKYR